MCTCVCTVSVCTVSVCNVVFVFDSVCVLKIDVGRGMQLVD